MSLMPGSDPRESAYIRAAPTQAYFPATSSYQLPPPHMQQPPQQLPSQSYFPAATTYEVSQAPQQQPPTFSSLPAPANRGYYPPAASVYLPPHQQQPQPHLQQSMGTPSPASLSRLGSFSASSGSSMLKPALITPSMAPPAAASGTDAAAPRGYAQICKVLLKQKMFSVLWITSLMATVLFLIWNLRLESPVTTFWRIFSRQFFGRLLSLNASLTLLISLNRKVYTVKRVVHKKAYEKWTQFLKPSIFLFLLFHIFSGCVMVWVLPHSQGISWSLALTNAGLFGLVYAIRHFLREENQIVFPVINQPVFYSIKGRLPSILVSSLAGSLVYNTCFGVAHMFFSRSLEILDLSIFIKFIMSNTLMASLWIMHRHVFEIVLTQPAPVMESDISPFRCLASGLAEKEDIIQHLAFKEFVSLDAPKRKKMFEDLGKPPAWLLVSAECLKVVDSLTASLEETKTSMASQRGKAKSEVYTAPPEALRFGKPEQLQDQNAVLSVSAFASTKMLIKDNVFSKRPAGGSTPTGSAAAAPSEPIPTIFRVDKDLVKKPAASKTAVPIKGQGPLENPTVLDFLGSIIQKRLPKQFSHLPSLDNPQSIFHNIQMQIWAVRGLSEVVSASFSEDRYGVVQRNLPAVITSLVNLLLQLEGYISSPPLSRHSHPNFQSVQPQALAMVQVVESAVYKITTTFGETLNELKLPPHVTSKLKSFYNFSQ